MPHSPIAWAPTRAGQWVLFRAGLPAQVAARPHLTASGWHVGVWCAADKHLPARVQPVTAGGLNVEFTRAGKGHAFWLTPNEIDEWAPLLSPADLPPGRALLPGQRLRP